MLDRAAWAALFFCFASRVRLFASAMRLFAPCVELWGLGDEAFCLTRDPLSFDGEAPSLGAGASSLMHEAFCLNSGAPEPRRWGFELKDQQASGKVHSDPCS